MVQFNTSSTLKAICASVVCFALLMATLPSFVPSSAEQGPSIQWLSSGAIEVPVEPRASVAGPPDLNHWVLVTQELALVLQGAKQICAQPDVSPCCLTRKHRLSLSPAHSPPAC